MVRMYTIDGTSEKETEPEMPVTPLPPYQEAGNTSSCQKAGLYQAPVSERSVYQGTSRNVSVTNDHTVEPNWPGKPSSCQEAGEYQAPRVEEGVNTGKLKVSWRYLKERRRRKWQEMKATKEIIDSKLVPQEFIQDIEAKIMILGFDAESLYPNLKLESIRKLIFEGILASSITWQDIDYKEALRYIALNWTGRKCEQSKLRKYLPVRSCKKGRRPGITGSGPMGQEIGVETQWIFPEEELEEVTKKMIIATVVEIVTEVMFTSHLYTFGGKVYKQKDGGPTGLRGTCCIARLTMCMWDRAWQARLAEVRILEGCSSNQSEKAGGGTTTPVA